MSKRKKIYMIGNAHIDPVWRWRWTEGFQEVKATFRSALDRMNESDDFVFTCSSAAFYEWVEKNNPAMFEEIRRRVAEGRWEIVGGWWIQPDCNLPSGESFVRQGLYGQRYFLEKFGVAARTGYNVDSFGHNANLPQLLKKSGMDNYVFMRPMPHERKLASRLFTWRAADGSAVLAYRLPYTYCIMQHDMERYITEIAAETDGEDMLFYGVGNHGGGPTKENIRFIRELDGRKDLPAIKPETTARFFDEARRKNKSFPEYRGDLHHHASGCYAVMSQVKKQNRAAENALVEAESWCAVVAAGGRKYPSDFGQAWKGVLFNQFHDILAGTCIRSAYDDASNLYGRAMACAAENLNYALQGISWDVDIAQEENMRPIVVFNSHAWACKAPVELEVRGLVNDDFRLTDDEGKEVPAQRTRSEATAVNQSRLLFVADLPPMGYAVYKLYLGSLAAAVEGGPTAADDAMENEFVRLEFTPSGEIKSLVNKHMGAEMLRGLGGRLAVVEDKSDTWAHGVLKFDNIIGYMTEEKRRVTERGPVRAAVEIEYRYKNSTAVLEYALYRGLDYAEIKARVDWHEPLTQLKICFPLALGSRKVTCEIPYGFIERGESGEEEPMQTWLDCSGESGVGACGLAVATDSKYAYSMDANEMRITALRNSVFSHHNPKQIDDGESYRYTDEGAQEFVLALIPHEGALADSDVVKRAKELNVRPKTIIETYHRGSLPPRKSFLSLESDHVLVGAVKESEDGSGVIVRAWETKGRAGRAALRAPFLGRETEPDFSPCEIKTVLFPYDAARPPVEVDMTELNEKETEK